MSGVIVRCEFAAIIVRYNYSLLCCYHRELLSIGTPDEAPCVLQLFHRRDEHQEKILELWEGELHL